MTIGRKLSLRLIEGIGLQHGTNTVARRHFQQPDSTLRLRRPILKENELPIPRPTRCKLSRIRFEQQPIVTRATRSLFIQINNSGTSSVRTKNDAGAIWRPQRCAIALWIERQ